MPSQSPVDLARIALRRVAELQLPPTPENFARCYAEASGQTLPEAASNPPAFDAGMIQRVDDLVGRAVETTQVLSSGLGQHESNMAQSLESLLDGSSTDQEAGSLLRSVAQTTRDIHATVMASRAELLNTQRSLADIKAELIESRKLLGQDPLTGTENRRAMDAILEREISRSRRDGEPLAVVLVDIDHFKMVNDTHGHLAGDAALIHLTRIAKSLLRGNDAFIRYGGEEFLLVLPETGLQGGVSAGQRLQAALKRQPLVYHGKTIPMTLSGGVGALAKDDSEETLIRRADAALYRAKSGGRNQVLASVDTERSG